MNFRSNVLRNHIAFCSLTSLTLKFSQCFKKSFLLFIAAKVCIGVTTLSSFFFLFCIHPHHPQQHLSKGESATLLNIMISKEADIVTEGQIIGRRFPRSSERNPALTVAQGDYLEWGCAVMVVGGWVGGEIQGHLFHGGARGL